jgi:hypothetical protein
MTYTEDMEKHGPSIIIRRVVTGNYLVIKDRTGKLGSRVTPATALALRNDMGINCWILPVINGHQEPAPEVDPDTPVAA